MSDETTAAWTTDSLGDLTGTSALVTGANSGIGLAAATALAGAGAHVVLACRDAQRGEAALAAVRDAAPHASAVVRRLDLADLVSVRELAATLPPELPQGRLDVLVNNAGVMAIPHRRTADGFEMQLGTNHLGHFALTGLLLGALLAAPEPRVVTVTSAMHRIGRLHAHDLMLEHRYARWSAYGQSKLANLLFTLELQRRADSAGVPLTSTAAHPGFAATNLQQVGARMDGMPWLARLSALASRAVGQSPEAGAWPTLRAAVDDLPGGALVGPRGGMRGLPVVETPSTRAADPGAAAWLWQRSVELTGVDYAALAPPSA